MQSPGLNVACGIVLTPAGTFKVLAMVPLYLMRHMYRSSHTLLLQVSLHKHTVNNDETSVIDCQSVYI